MTRSPPRHQERNQRNRNRPSCRQDQRLECSRRVEGRSCQHGRRRGGEGFNSVVRDLERDERKEIEGKKTFGSRVCKGAKVISGIFIALGLVFVFYAISVTIIDGSSSSDNQNYWDENNASVLHKDDVFISTEKSVIPVINDSSQVGSNNVELSSVDEVQRNESKGTTKMADLNSQETEEGSHKHYLPIPLNEYEDYDYNEYERGRKEDGGHGGSEKVKGDHMFFPIKTRLDSQGSRSRLRIQNSELGLSYGSDMGRADLPITARSTHQPYGILPRRKPYVSAAGQRTGYSPYPESSKPNPKFLPRAPLLGRTSLRIRNDPMSERSFRRRPTTMRNLRVGPRYRPIKRTYIPSSRGFISDRLKQLRSRQTNSARLRLDHDRMRTKAIIRTQPTHDNGYSAAGRVPPILTRIPNVRSRTGSRSRASNIQETFINRPRHRTYLAERNRRIVLREPIGIPSRQSTKYYTQPSSQSSLVQRRYPSQITRQGKGNTYFTRSSRHTPPTEYRYPPSSKSIQDIIDYLERRERARYNSQEKGNFKPNRGNRNQFQGGLQNHKQGNVDEEFELNNYKNPPNDDNLHDFHDEFDHIYEDENLGHYSSSEDFSHDDANFYGGDGAVIDHNFQEDPKHNNNPNIIHGDTYFIDENGNIIQPHEDLSINTHHDDDNHYVIKDGDHGDKFLHTVTDYRPSYPRKPDDVNLPPVRNTYDVASERSKPFNVMIDIYPRDDDVDNKFQTILTLGDNFDPHQRSSEVNSNSKLEEYNEKINSHKIVLHVNLFAKQPAQSKPPAKRDKSLSMDFPLLGRLSPLDVYKGILSQARSSPQASAFNRNPSGEAKIIVQEEVENELPVAKDGLQLYTAIKNSLKNLNLYLPDDKQFIFQEASHDDITKIGNYVKFDAKTRLIESEKLASSMKETIPIVTANNNNNSYNWTTQNRSMYNYYEYNTLRGEDYYSFDVEDEGVEDLLSQGHLPTSTQKTYANPTATEITESRNKIVLTQS